MKELNTDVLIVGGGLGGVAAALTALRMGCSVILTEETDWIGGQSTSQAVPPDEHPWIEECGCTRTYRRLRDSIREYYRRNYPLLDSARGDPRLNPGMGSVSFISHEPRVALAVLEEMLAQYHATGRVIKLLNHRPVAAETDGDYVRSVTLADKAGGDTVVIRAQYTLDATELGELLPLAGVEHVMGAESQAQTGEPHALPGDPDPLDQQAISWYCALDYLPGEDHTIDRPETYDFWCTYQASFWPAPQLSWTTCHPITLEPISRPLFAAATDEREADDLWHYRRIFYRKHYPDSLYRSDITLCNWMQTDYWLGPLVGVSEDEEQRNMHAAKQLGLSFLYWMQTEAPRDDGGVGYPGLRPRGDVLGTSDGMTKQPYIRESRRIKAEFTVLEQHIGTEARGKLQGAESFHDSVGIGTYRIDLHPSTGQRNYIDVSNWPFQIPLGALIPVRVENLLPANKNIGTTHITNGCYRLHPVEWNVGEAAAALAAYCLEKGLAPRQVRGTPNYLADFQRVLADLLGIELHWPESVRLTPRDTLFGVKE